MTGAQLRDAGVADVLAADCSVTWKPIPEWEEFYEVSNDGRVRRFDYWQPGGNGARRLIPAGPVSTWENSDGYTNVELKRKKRRVLASVHVLVLEAFTGPRPLPDSVARHLDGNPANNTLANLAWGTPAENTQDMIRHGRHVNLRKAECPRGHPYDAANTRVKRDGRRGCRACQREYDRSYRLRKKRASAA